MNVVLRDFQLHIISQRRFQSPVSEVCCWKLCLCCQLANPLFVIGESCFILRKLSLWGQELLRRLFVWFVAPPPKELLGNFGFSVLRLYPKNILSHSGTPG